MYNFSDRSGTNFFNIRKELDYSVSNTGSIDSRVLQVCNDAESNYLENQNTINEIKRMKHFDYRGVISDNKNSKNRIQKRDSDEANKEYRRNYNRSNSKNINIVENDNPNKRSLSKPKSQNFDGIKSPILDERNLRYSDIRKSNSEVNNEKYYAFSNQSLNVINKKSIDNSENKFSEKIKSNRIDIRTSNSGINIPFNHNHMKSGKKCIACELKKKIQNKGEFEHVDHVKFKINYDTNKVLLEAKSLMKKLNFKKSYEMLKLPISQGLYHADIFYLFGEVCRMLKKLEDSEKYLLECLKFEHHSPFVFYSLGLLYQELQEFRYSVCFFKHFVQIIETGEAHYQLSKSYIGLKKNLKAAIHITKAININQNVKEYYQFRANIYEMMGFKELALEDLQLAKSLVKVD